MNIPRQTNDARSTKSLDSDEESSCLSRRNMILCGAAVVAAMSLPKNIFGINATLNDRPAFQEQR